MGCARFPPQRIVFRSNQGAMDMERYVHRRTWPCSRNVTRKSTVTSLFCITAPSEAQCKRPGAPNDSKAFLSQLGVTSIVATVSDFGW